MSDPFDPAKMRVSLARLFRNIETLAADLHTQALNSPNAKDFPGGDALHMLAPAASIADWEAQYEETEAAERWAENGDDRWAKRPKLDPAIYQGDAEDQPLNVLESWTRIIREERDQPTGLKATVSRELAYLSGSLDWMCTANEWDEPAWPAVFEVKRELKALERRMEDVLREGDRIDTDAAPCFQVDIEGNRCGGTLARVNLRPRSCIHAQYAQLNRRSLVQLLSQHPEYEKAHKDCDQGGRDDLYRCLKCEKNYTTTEYWLAVREHMEREAG